MGMLHRFKLPIIKHHTVYYSSELIKLSSNVNQMKASKAYDQVGDDYTTSHRGLLRSTAAKSDAHPQSVRLYALSKSTIGHQK